MDLESILSLNADLCPPLVEKTKNPRVTTSKLPAPRASPRTRGASRQSHVIASSNREAPAASLCPAVAVSHSRLPSTSSTRVVDDEQEARGANKQKSRESEQRSDATTMPPPPWPPWLQKAELPHPPPMEGRGRTVSCGLSIIPVFIPD